MFSFYINLILFFISLLFLIYFTYNPIKHYRFLFKTITSLLFISMAFISCLHFHCEFNYFILIMAGLIFSLFGDMFLALKISSSTGSLNRKFVYGLISFSLAHIMYICAFTSLNDFNKLDLNITFLFSIIIIYILNKVFDFKNLLTPIWIYSFIILLMLFESAKLAFSSSLNIFSSSLLLLGTILFVISDIILSFVLFSKKSNNFLSSINLLTYYTGQILIASHLYFITM